MLSLPVYLDHNATTPCDQRVVDAMVPYFTQSFGNAASRSHSFGWHAREAVELAREQVAALIGAEPQEIIFTSGATESDNLAIKGVFEAYASKGNHIITGATEHKAVLDTCSHIEKIGGRVTYLPVNALGHIDLQELEAAITPETVLIALMWANNETGTLHPVREIGAMAKKHGVLFFTDAAQAAGKIPVAVNAAGVDLLALTAHKMYGPKGIGALYVRRRGPRVRLLPQMDGGGHERGLRSGTLNVPGIVGFGKACELAKQEMEQDAGELSKLRNRLEKELLKLPDVFVNGDSLQRLPHVTNLSFKDVESEALLTGLNRSIALSSGSACTSALIEPSYVLKAMGLSDELAYSSLRFALGRFTTAEQIDFTIEQVSKTVSYLREIKLEAKIQ